MKREVVDCDHCGAREVAPISIYPAIGRRFDGVETVTDYEQLDLCPKCAASLLEALLKDAGHEGAGKIVKAWKTRRSP